MYICQLAPIGKKWHFLLYSHLGPLVYYPDVLPQVAVLFAADGAGRPELVVHIEDVPLQVRLEVAAVATLAALEIFDLGKKVVAVYSSAIYF